jgi:DNA-directed RNA polymerase specialized sigma subunit
MTSVFLQDPSEDQTLLRLRHAELQEWLTEVILLMPEQERLVFTLYYYEMLTAEEIKQVLGATESSICQLQASALSCLHTSLADHANCAHIAVARCGKTIQKRTWRLGFQGDPDPAC